MGDTAGLIQDCKGKIIFSSRVSLGVLTTQKGRPIPSICEQLKTNSVGFLCSIALFGYFCLTGLLLLCYTMK